MVDTASPATRLFDMDVAVREHEKYYDGWRVFLLELWGRDKTRVSVRLTPVINPMHP